VSGGTAGASNASPESSINRSSNQVRIRSLPESVRRGGDALSQRPKEASVAASAASAAYPRRRHHAYTQ
jgi:hypothetical protein